MSIDKPNELALMAIWQGAELLVQDRTHSKIEGIGFWGGKVQEGEDPLDAALREVGEEISEEMKARIEQQINGLPAINRERIVRAFEPIKSNGWLINAFQTSLPADEKVKVNEGAPVRILPLDLYRHPRVMEATRAVLKEIILKPNGIIDN